MGEKFAWSSMTTNTTSRKIETTTSHLVNTPNPHSDVQQMKLYYNHEAADSLRYRQVRIQKTILKKYKKNSNAGTSTHYRGLKIDS